MRHLIKRLFDIAASAFGLIVFGWLIIACWIIASIDTRSNGFFVQTRIGRHGKPFKIVKIKTMRNRGADTRSSVTTASMAEITPSGRIMRRFKLDELPQLWNVLIGNMSFVGPRPDVPGFADQLEGADRKVLSLRPGITGPASLAFRDEETLLATVDDPEHYNHTIIWPEKVRLNKHYADTFSLSGDIRYIMKTILK